jgi:hypothetical protein
MQMTLSELGLLDEWCHLVIFHSVCQSKNNKASGVYNKQDWNWS